MLVAFLNIKHTKGSEIMLPLFFIVWIIFNGRITLEITVFGIVIAGLMFGFVCKFMDYSIEKERNLYKKLPLFGKYVVLLISEIWKNHEHKKDLEHWFVLRYAAFKEKATVIGRSLSYGLVLFCMGLCATLIYLLITAFQ